MPRRTAVVLTTVLVALSVSACTATADRLDVGGGSGAPTDDAVDSVVTPDPWIDAFDDRAAAIGESAHAVAWGGFGPAGDAAPAGWADASLPAGDHVVTVECDGPDVVTVTVTPGEAPPDDAAVTHELACPGGASLPITTDIVGLSVTIDNHGQPGAYLTAVDVTP